MVLEVSDSIETAAGEFLERPGSPRAAPTSQSPLSGHLRGLEIDRRRPWTCTPIPRYLGSIVSRRPPGRRSRIASDGHDLACQWTREAAPCGPPARGCRDEHDTTIDLVRARRRADVLLRPQPRPV